MNMAPLDQRLYRQLDGVSRFEATIRGVVPSFNQAELSELCSRWKLCKKAEEQHSREGINLAVELAIRVPGMLEFAVHNQPAVVREVYQEMAREIISRSSAYSLTHWLGKFASMAVSSFTAGATRDQVLALTAGGESSLQLRADLAERVFAKLQTQIQ